MATDDRRERMEQIFRNLSEDQRAKFVICAAVGDTIRELGHIPSGHLYTRLMSFLTLEQYQEVLDALTRAQLIEVKNHVIFWKANSN